MNQDSVIKNLKKNLDLFRYKYDLRTVWSDFISLSAIVLDYLEWNQHPERVKIKSEIEKRYQPEDLRVFERMFEIIVDSLRENPNQDLLGEIFMGLELGSAQCGQYFTPFCVSLLMARLQFVEPKKSQVETVSDPSCGSGGTLLAFLSVAAEKNIPLTHYRIYAQDISATAALMCFIQLSIIGAAGYVGIGDTLLHPFGNPELEVWQTPVAIKERMAAV